MQAHVTTQHMAHNPILPPVLLASHAARSKPDDLALMSAGGSFLMQRNNATSTSSVIEHLLCPLCQEKCTGRSSLERHLQATHNVNKEGVDKLLLLVDPPAWTVDTTGSSAADGEGVKSGTNTPVSSACGGESPDLKNGADVETDAIRIREDGEYD